MPPAGAGQIPASPEYFFADLADLALPSGVIGDIIVTDARALDPARAPGVAADRARLYVEARLGALIRGAGGLPPEVRFLADVPRDARGRVPDLEKRRFLLFANGDPDRAGDLRLVAPDALLAWSPEADAAVRAIARAATDGSAPPAVTGIASAFHVAGTVLGESETQLFLSTATGAPVSVSIVRRPGTAPAWVAAFGEVVDEGSGQPARETLGWYRLACSGLPRDLPPAKVESGDPAAAAADWRLVMRDLGDCPRGRGR